MINLLIAILLICTSFGVTLAKITTDYGFKKQRQHIKPLTLDKEVLKHHS